MVQIDEFSKNKCFVLNNTAKSQYEEEKQVFSFKMVYQYLKKPWSFWQNVVFTDETRVRISSDGIVKRFSKKRNENSLEKTQKI